MKRGARRIEIGRRTGEPPLREQPGADCVITDYRHCEIRERRSNLVLRRCPLDCFASSVTAPCVAGHQSHVRGKHDDQGRGF